MASALESSGSQRSALLERDSSFRIISAESSAKLSSDSGSCRICNSVNVRRVGDVEYYFGFGHAIYDCLECRSRFTKHDEWIYEALHREAGSCYDAYRSFLEQCSRAFDQGNREDLRSLLCKTKKYRFIIERVESQPKSARLLEMGCSRGYLTSYFILAGYEITGADVSETAIASATAAFGDHFVIAGDAAIEESAPYDLVYHVGTIGCVADPLGLTHRLLSLLRPGGKLLFNAPNLDSCYLEKQLWIDSAPPPDLVSIFAPGFWVERFLDEAHVEIQIENCEPQKALEIGLRKLFRRGWQPPYPIPMDGASELYLTDNRITAYPMWRVFEKSVLKLGRETGLSRISPPQPSEFGVFVTMTRR
ncbi:MAG TPA: class I SAM-dependent methyltransferase [Pyrinomonadaceae bacterium]|nr:class I SAM-dependent methyltransferase [Pyrinomonadaceae bacterium]